MLRIANQRNAIYDYFHQTASCQRFFFAATQDQRYAAYYTSMYLLQDTTESLISHRSNGFSSDSLHAYIEIWGVMQALFIQQDSICELYEAVTDSPLELKDLVSWQSLRKVRNYCAGHPAKRDRPKTSPISRTFMGRSFGDYSAITYEQWQLDGGISHRIVNLGALIDSYAGEAEAQLATTLLSMKQQWP